MTNEIIVLSVQQPWAHWMFHARGNFGFKNIENRTWPIPKWLLAKLPATLYIASSAKQDRSFPKRNCDEIGCVYGSILGHVTLMRCIPPNELGCIAHMWGELDQWKWVLENPTLLKAPIPAKGRLGIWKTEIEVSP